MDPCVGSWWIHILGPVGAKLLILLDPADPLGEFWLLLHENFMENFWKIHKLKLNGSMFYKVVIFISKIIRRSLKLVFVT